MKKKNKEKEKMKKQKCHKQESLILNGEGQKWKNSGEKKKT